MRLTIAHLLTVMGLLTLGILFGEAGLSDPTVGVISGSICGLALFLAGTGPILRWLCVWPLIPRCAHCGIWVKGFHRAGGPEGLLLIASPCHHVFILQGKWVAPPLRLSSGRQSNLAQELGWAVSDDGWIFRYRPNYAAILLDEEGAAIGRRRALWPCWIVRWTVE